ncbi:DUF6377 domain-containing protein [Pollutibacter soli]|uniref:DUF6377 domain-containing protein n=1 Tax=Pollutibacter soli TaxID=3034157 RepID=UPI003013AFC4
MSKNYRHIYLLRRPALLYLFLTLGTVVLPNNVKSQSDVKKWLTQLRKEISRTNEYDREKLTRIQNIRQQAGTGKMSAFDQGKLLYTEFASNSFDSAYYYAKEMSENAVTASEKAVASIKTAMILLSTGMYKEVFDILDSLDVSELENNCRKDYFILKARNYFDLADFAKEKYYTNEYNLIASRVLDSALYYSDSDTFSFLYYNGLKSIRSNNIKSATAYFNQLINSEKLTLREQAILNSTYGDIHIRKGKNDSAIILLAKAAIADIQSSTKETSAIFNLATLLFKSGDLQNASIFIQKASDDARIYGAKQRMIQLSTILPMIEAERLSVMEREKINITRYALIITVLFLFLSGLIFIVVRQVKKLKAQQELINNKNFSLHHLIKEKEWLLKEAHHRVKNNLHTINSLLESQAAFLNGDALLAIRQSQHRVYAMSLIHQKLYNPETNGEGIDMQMYITELVKHLKDSFEDAVIPEFELFIDPVILDIALAVPLGLICNEAITNAVRHAFRGRTPGITRILLRKIGNNALEMIVSDNGNGLSAKNNEIFSRTLGIRLMKGLSDDIAATIDITGNNGVSIKLELDIGKSMGYLNAMPVV